MIITINEIQFAHSLEVFHPTNTSFFIPQPIAEHQQNNDNLSSKGSQFSNIVTVVPANLAASEKSKSPRNDEDSELLNQVENLRKVNQ